MRRRVVVTGMGAITPIGSTLPRLWASVLAGVSGVAETRATPLPRPIGTRRSGWSSALHRTLSQGA